MLADSKSLQHPRPSSYASQCSLRGESTKSPHPLRQSSSISRLDDSTFQNVDFAESIRPPPSAFTSAATAYDPHSDLPSPTPSPLNIPASPRFGHQRSLTGTFLDNSQNLITRATSTLQQHTQRASFHSPTKSLASFIPSRSTLESKASQPNIRAGAKALQNWFNGASAPVTLGIGQQSRDESSSNDSDYDSEDDYEDEEGTMMAGIFNRGPSLTQSPGAERREQSPALSPKSGSPSASNRFAWLLSTQKNAATPAPPSPIYHNPSDELLNLNISQALFPHGPVDPLAPSSFNDLLSTAETLLSRFQTSYRQVSTSLVDAQAEQSAQDDELDEADTRIRHLKSQMEIMAARAADQDEQMRMLMEELMFEKRAREEEEAAQKRNLELMRSDATCRECNEVKSPRRRNRVSNSDVSVDSGFESEVETDAASIFSQKDCLSPTGTDLSSVAEIDRRETTPRGKTPQAFQQRSSYANARTGTATQEKSSWGCSNCEGGSQSAVWGRLAKEREENSMLRRRVGDLEEAVEGALNVVAGPWGM
jgi:hypothetical protein